MIENYTKNKTGFVRFDSDPRGSNIFVDGILLIHPETEETIKTPAKIELPVGRRDFVYRLQGYDDIIGYVDVIDGTTVNINRNLKSYTGKTITPLDDKVNDKINYKVNDKINYKVNDKINYKVNDKINYKVNDKINEKLNVITDNIYYNVNQNQMYTDQSISDKNININKIDKTNKNDTLIKKDIIHVPTLLTDKDIPFLLSQLLRTNNRLVQLMEEQSKKQDVKDTKESKEKDDTKLSAEQKEERIRDGRGDESVSKGDIKTHIYRDYYDRHHTIVTANASDPNDPDSPVYTTNADQIDQIYITLGRNADKIFVSNDSSYTLFAIISHKGKTNFSKEEPIYAGEVKVFWNVYEMRFRSATQNVNYRVTEYRIIRTV